MATGQRPDRLPRDDPWAPCTGPTLAVSSPVVCCDTLFPETDASGCWTQSAPLLPRPCPLQAQPPGLRHPVVIQKGQRLTPVHLETPRRPPSGTLSSEQAGPPLPCHTGQAASPLSPLLVHPTPLPQSAPGRLKRPFLGGSLAAPYRLLVPQPPAAPRPHPLGGILAAGVNAGGQAPAARTLKTPHRSLLQGPEPWGCWLTLLAVVSGFSGHLLKTKKH